MLACRSAHAVEALSLSDLAPQRRVERVSVPCHWQARYRAQRCARHSLNRRDDGAAGCGRKEHALPHGPTVNSLCSTRHDHIQSTRARAPQYVVACERIYQGDRRWE